VGVEPATSTHANPGNRGYRTFGTAAATL
jgi:hypothetical protein